MKNINFYLVLGILSAMYLSNITVQAAPPAVVTLEDDLADINVDQNQSENTVLINQKEPKQNILKDQLDSSALQTNLASEQDIKEKFENEALKALGAALHYNLSVNVKRNPELASKLYKLNSKYIIRFNTKGKFMDFQTYESSDNDAFNQACIDALTRTKYPELEHNLTNEFKINFLCEADHLTVYKNFKNLPKSALKDNNLVNDNYLSDYQLEENPTATYTNFDEYMEYVQNKIGKNWRINKRKHKQTSSATYRFELNEDGRILGEPEFVAGHASESYKATCLDTLRKSEPFSPLPTKGTVYIEFTFDYHVQRSSNFSGLPFEIGF
jgi:hypothetical protein